MTDNMVSGFKVIDLFAGPGGLAEGFSSLRATSGRRIFDVALSVEKEATAFATLRLRSFFRQFEEVPEAYYQYLAQRISHRDLTEQYSVEWKRAVEETAMLELATDRATELLDPVLDRLRATSGDRIVLIGGPPCQAYSLVGRARNRGIAGYDAAGDHRHFLYQEYIRILGRLQPIAFVMENVKGMLSSRVAGESMIERIMEDLRHAGGSSDSYRLIPLTIDDRGTHPGHVVRSEEFGIPQRRHRVILLGLRSDVRNARSAKARMPLLQAADSRSTVASVLDGMPRLRSGLSKSRDDPSRWRSEAVCAFRTAARACANVAGLQVVARRLSSHAEGIAGMGDLPRSSNQVTAPVDNRLGLWLTDPRLAHLPNHESRGHMAEDLARYAFASTFAQVVGHSPKANEFPRALAPSHRNWETGKFADRFRVQLWDEPATTITSHISKDGHYFIHPDPLQCRSLTVREAARLQTFPDNYLFEGNRTQQYVQVGNAVPPLLARQIAELMANILSS
jgi:DNA (cytosine-5)-methyltransferase 1